MLIIDQRKFTKEELENLNLGLFIEKYMKDKNIFLQNYSTVYELAKKYSKNFIIANGSVMIDALVFDGSAVKPDRRTTTSIYM